MGPLLTCSDRTESADCPASDRRVTASPALGAGHAASAASADSRHGAVNIGRACARTSATSCHRASQSVFRR